MSLRSSSSSSSPPPLELPTWDTVPFSNLPDVLGPSFTSGYELRPGPRIEGKEIFPTWLDQDGTATYHPDCKQDPYINPPTEIFEGIKRGRPARSGEGLVRSKVPKIITWQRGRFEGKRLPVRISFTTVKGKDALALFGSSLDNWPNSAWRSPNEKIDWETWWDAVPTPDDYDLPDSSSGRRERLKMMSRGQEPNRDNQLRLLEEITLGHPEARGCKGCVELGQRCPLLDEGSGYPCDICIDDGCDCELIRDPVKKQGCLNCGRKRVFCSYREADSIHSLPCTNCAAKGLSCIAGPASGRTRTGPALDSATPGRVRTIREAFARCTQSGKSKRQCSSFQHNMAPNCNENPKYGKDDIFKATRRSNARAVCCNPPIMEAQDSSTENPKLTQDDIQFIRTRLAHPILLNCNQDAQCHWCHDVGYGIVGLGPELKVEVLDMNDGGGYVEVRGGYVDAGLDFSRMCTDCTLDRLEIAGCLEHNIEGLKEIEGSAVDNFNSIYVMDYLMPGRAASAPFTWCSVCPNPAFYTCCKPMNKEVQALLGTNGNQVGCGLKLCHKCAEALVHDEGGNLDALVRAIREQDTDGFALRADVDFILRGGEVVRRMGWMFALGADLP